MIERARKVEGEEPADEYIYIIKCKRKFIRPELNGLYRGPKMYSNDKINNERQEILDDLLEKVKEEDLDLSSVEYNSDHSNCFEFNKIVENQQLPMIRKDYPMRGVIKWNDVYLPSWVVISFFNRGGLFYVGESAGNLVQRIRSHKKGETRFFKIHDPVDLLEAWSIDFHKFRERSSNRFGIFNEPRERKSQIEEYVRSSLSKKLDGGRRKPFVYCN